MACTQCKDASYCCRCRT